MTILVNDILQLVANWVLPDGEEAKNVYYVQMTDLGNASNEVALTELRNYIDNVMEGSGNVISDALVPGLLEIYRRNTVTNQWDNEGSRIITFTNPNPAEIVSNQETAVAFGNTDNPRVTARKSWPGFNTGDLEVNTWSVAAQNALTTMALRWLNPINDQNIQLVAGCWSVVNNAFFPFTGSGVIRTLVGSMDTRKP